MFRILAHASLAMQTAFSCLLLCLLEFYYRRVAREPWLRWFAFSWVAQGAYVASVWVIFDHPDSGFLPRALASLLAFLVPATIILTSLALWDGRTPARRWIAAVYLAALAASVIRFKLGLPYPADAVQASRIHNIPTYFSFGIASLIAAVTFTRYGRKNRLAGALVTAAAWVIYAAFNLVRAGLWFQTTTWSMYGAENNPAMMQFALLTFITNSSVWIVMSIGIGLLLTESAERSERRARQALRELQEAQAERGRLAQLVEQSRDAILVACQGQIRYLNRAAAVVLGYGAEDIPSLLLKPLDVVCGYQSDDSMRLQMESALAATGVWEGQSEWRNYRTGEGIPVLVGAVTMEAREGEPASTGLIARDLRERVRLEDALRQAQRQEAVGRLAGGIAHDFNNLLTVIMGFSSLALEEQLSDRLRQTIGEILNAARRAAAITDRLLAFGRRQPRRAGTFEMNALVQSMRGALDKLVDGQVELIYDLCPGPLPVRADAAQIEQVLMNLVVNARQAIDGPGTITVRTGISIDYAQIQVEDTGCGMEPAVLEHIFDPYFTTRSAGSGLGLAMAYGIIRQSDGHILVDSRPGRGSIFTVRLPTSDREATAAEPPLAAGLPTSRGSESILVVDDRPDVAALVSASLKSYGYQVVSYVESEAALVAVRDGVAAPQLVIRDVMMPGISLQDFAAQLRELRPGVPMVCMSGLPKASVAAMIEGTGGYFIAKPFEAEQLAAMVRNVLDAATLLARD